MTDPDPEPDPDEPTPIYEQLRVELWPDQEEPCPTSNTSPETNS